MITIRGLKLLYVKQFIEDNYDPSVWKTIVENATPQVKTILENPITSGKMYDIEAERHVLKTFRKETGVEELIKCAEDGARKQLIGLFGIVAKFVSANMLLSKTQWMWDRAFSQGKTVVTRMGEKEITVDVTDFEFTEDHRIFVQHYIRTLVELAYKKKVSSTSSQKGKGAYQFIFTITDKDLEK